ncbi:MAG TPA: hypothetical protein VFF78_01060, partial [Anaerolineaceae bacterium]|nr:hypothetical protein [Anaerolineaceae bacterium]
MQYKQLFSRSWAHLRSSRTIWALALISVAVSVLASFISDRLLVFFFLLIQFYVQIICSAGFIWTVSMLEQHKTPTLAEAYQAVRPYFWRMVGLGFLVGIISALLAFP